MILEYVLLQSLPFTLLNSAYMLLGEKICFFHGTLTQIFYFSIACGKANKG